MSRDRDSRRDGAAGGAGRADVRSWPLRPLSAELRQRYWEEGHWDDDTLGAFLHHLVAAAPRLDFRIWSRTRPFRAELGAVYRRG